MRGKKVTAIKRIATSLNEGEKLNGSEMRILKRLNKNRSIPLINKIGLKTK